MIFPEASPVNDPVMRVPPLNVVEKSYITDAWEKKVRANKLHTASAFFSMFIMVSPSNKTSHLIKAIFVPIWLRCWKNNATYSDSTLFVMSMCKKIRHRLTYGFADR